MSEQQLTLAPPHPLTGFLQRVPLVQIAPTQTLPLDAEFEASIRMYGVLQPVVLERTLKGPYGYRLLAGRRRVEGARRVHGDDSTATVPAYVLQLGEWDGAAQIAALENEQRSANPLQTLELLAGLAARGVPETVISQELGIPAQRQRRLMRLTALLPALREAWAAGKLTSRTAEAAAKLSQADQERLVELLATRKRLTGADVATLRRVERGEAIADLFASLGPEQEAVAVVPLRPSAATWQERALAHIRAALAELPPDLAEPMDSELGQHLRDAYSKAAAGVLQDHGAHLTSVGTWATPWPLLVAAATSFGTPVNAVAPKEVSVGLH